MRRSKRKAAAAARDEAANVWNQIWMYPQTRPTDRYKNETILIHLAAIRGQWPSGTDGVGTVGRQQHAFWFRGLHPAASQWLVVDAHWWPYDGDQRRFEDVIVVDRIWYWCPTDAPAWSEQRRREF